MPFVPHSTYDVDKILKKIAVGSIDDLFADIPEELRAKSFDLGAGMSEQELFSQLSGLAGRNRLPKMSFMGAGYYNHYVPAAVDSLAARPEFYTAYTPYQPEASQGWLQAIFEYQTAICELTDMDVSNASLYDGTTALVEAALMAMKITRRNKVVIDGAVNPVYRNVLNTYSKRMDFQVFESPVCFPFDSESFLSTMITDDAAALIIQNPDFFGRVNDLEELISHAHQKGMLVIMITYPIALGMIRTPGEMGVDIVVAEGQCLGNNLSFGGPYLGIMATKDKYARKLPGRIVGQTKDRKSKDGFVLTLQAREQHIRREKATSNICSNQSLCALRALIYLALMGGEGLKELSQLIYERAYYMKEMLSKIPGICFYDYPMFNEFVIGLPIPASLVVSRMAQKGIVPGLPLGILEDTYKNNLLVSVTEQNSRKDIDRFVREIEDVL